LELYIENGQLDDSIIDDYNAYFKPKIPDIHKFQNDLDERQRDLLAALEQGGVLGLTHFKMTQLRNHKQELEAHISKLSVELEHLHRPGIKFATRKLAGAVRRRAKKTLGKSQN
jgi:hypothetical protein